MANTNSDRETLLAVLRAVVGAILETVKETHDQDGSGCPESILHLALEQRGLSNFDHRCQVMELAISTGRVKREHHCLFWVGD
jgi:hypothetical protein